uniref:normal mucosa of esophagus-specific gene 1 protein n=1 Tax=Myxine glutinosa TaxID=7769 RepID=UPI00358EE81C
MASILRMMMKKKELIPLVGFVGMAGVGAVTMCIYSLVFKSDVSINKRGNPTPWENVDPRQPQKLITINQKWEPVEELDMLKKLTKQ